MVDDLNENLKQSPKEIIFYDLDEFNIKKIMRKYLHASYYLFLVR
jgi:FlaA1/EpsC-like NDP-sugar epimerase